MKILITETQLKYITDGVGDKYAEKEFGIPDETDNYTNPLSDKDIIVTRIGNNPIIKNPSNPDVIGNHARGIIDKDGNLYVEKQATDIHQSILQHISHIVHVDPMALAWGLGMPPRWNVMAPDELGFITVQKENDLIYVGLSHSPFIYSIDHNDEINLQEKLSFFKKFMDNAKIKNPKFNFIPEIFPYKTE